MISGCCQNNDVQNGAICFLMNIGGLKKSSIMENATSSDRRSGLQTWLVWGEGGGGRMQDQDLWALFNLLIMLTTTNSPALMNKQSLEFQTTSECRSRSIRLIVVFYVYILPGLRFFITANECSANYFCINYLVSSPKREVLWHLSGKLVASWACGRPVPRSDGGGIAYTVTGIAHRVVSYTVVSYTVQWYRILLMQ